jgi:iron complex transport system substrate-binding protein
MKKDKNKQINRNIDPKEKKEMSRRNFLFGVGSLMIGGVLGGGLLSGCKEESTTTKIVSSIRTVSVPTTVEVPVTSTVTETAVDTVTETATVTETETVTEKVAEPKTITITDVLGREVTLDLPINKISWAHMSISEGILAMGAWDRVVTRDGVVEDDILYPGLYELPVITAPQNSYDLDYEKLYEFEPDVFITADLPLEGLDEIIDRLEPDIPVVVLNLYDQGVLADGLQTLGKMFGAEQRAEDIIDWYQNIESIITDATSQLSDEEKPTVFLKMGWNAADIQTFTNEMSGFAKLWEQVGCLNIAADLPSQGGWVQTIDPEWLITADPEFIFVFDDNTETIGLHIDDESKAQAYLEEVMALPSFVDGTAVREGNVYMLDPAIVSSPRMILRSAYIAKAAHPDLFEAMDPQVFHQDYITRFLEMDIDLDEQGLFVYPEL